MVEHGGDRVALCMRIFSSCYHISGFSVSFVLYVQHWNRREVRKQHKREPGGVCEVLEVEEEIPLYESCTESCKSCRFCVYL